MNGVVPSNFFETPILKIVGDGVTWRGEYLQGRAVPVLIINSANREDINNLFSLHESLGRYGDVKHTWMISKNSPLRVFLALQFLDPVETLVSLEFDLPAQNILIDLLLHAESFFLQKSDPEPPVTGAGPQIFIELLREEDFARAWPELNVDLYMGYFKALKNNRGKKIYSKSESKKMALSRVRENQEIVNLKVQLSSKK